MMNRKTLTVEQLEKAGYRAFEFSDYTLADAVRYIKEGCETRLEPSFTGHMVAIVVVKVGVHKYEKEMFSRPMTAEERIKYADLMEDEKKKFDAATSKIHSRNLARMRRR